AKQGDSTTAITTPSDVHLAPAGNGLSDEPINVVKDDLELLLSASGGQGPLDRIVHSVHSANDVGAREARSYVRTSVNALAGRSRSNCIRHDRTWHPGKFLIPTSIQRSAVP